MHENPQAAESPERDAISSRQQSQMRFCASNTEEKADRGNGTEHENSLAREGIDLLLWALASRLEPEVGWFRAVQLTRQDIAALSLQHGGRYAQLRLIETIGNLLGRKHLEVLMRARLAEMLLAATGPKELAEIARVFDRLPVTAGAGTTVADTDESDGQLDGMDIVCAMNETRRLLTELENDPALRRLLEQEDGSVAENGTG